MPRQIPMKNWGRKSNQKPENEFRSAALKWLKIRFGRYFWHVKILGGLGQRAGIPDDLCCIRGKFVALEWKDPNRKPVVGPKQKKEIAAIQEAQGIAHVVASWEDLEKAVEDIEPVQLGMRRR